ncbi:MAG: hypothetical protein A2017_05945 [Lentisphaerae bacterium GWF2_44_16]|nr:MAG: hypothetical protein A2017_05945 [Lentisphaerae bacterium GWF2_44_16]
MSETIRNKDAKILCTKSGNRCALFDCHKELVIDAQNNDPASLIAEMAHIKGEKPTAPRYDINMTDEERNSYKNLILLCPSCHTKIDKQPNTYTVEYLHKIKNEHETWIIKSTKREAISVSFLELGIVTKHLLANKVVQNESLILIPPRDKIKKNGLSNSIVQQILIGMTQVTQVADFIAKMNGIESSFSEKLISSFVNEYEHLKNEGNYSSDELFDRLFDFSCSGSGDFKQRAAGLSVLVYLFEKCEVFEK